jgi:hypothetical protein
MRVHRALLYTGVFLVAIGGVLVAADASGVAAATIVDALRLWPLAVIAVGAGLVLRQSRFSLQGGLIGAALPGLVLGGAIAAAPTHLPDCELSSQVAIRQAIQREIADAIRRDDLDIDTVDIHPMGGCT